MSLEVGAVAPHFTLVDTNKNECSLSDFAGKKIVLAFYPGAFTGVCQKELCTFRDSLSEFENLNAQVIGISVDSPFANSAFAEQNNIPFPLLSDYTRTVSKQFGGVYEDFAGINGYSASKRAVYVIDSDGVITYSWVSDNPGVEPPYDGVKEAIG